MTVGVQLNIDSVLGDFLELSPIHDLQNSFRLQTFIINVEKTRYLGCKLILLQARSSLAFAIFDETSHDSKAALASSQIQRPRQAHTLPFGITASRRIQSM